MKRTSDASGARRESSPGPGPVALVNPFITSAERYGRDIGDIGGHQMPLGIFSLAAWLRTRKKSAYHLEQ